MIDIENMSILIVDDVKTMRSIVRKMLKNLDIGKTLLMAENGVEALRILNSARVDFIILDWKMPVMGGAALLEVIRQDKQLRDIPVLIISAESQQEIVLEAAEIEVNGYLIKPLAPAILDKTIRHILDQVNNPDEAAIHIKKSRYFEEKNNIPAAVEHMKHAVQLRPSASRVLRNLGLLYQKAGDENTMKKCLQKAAAVNSRDVVTRYLLAEYYWKNQDLISAAEYYLEVISTTRKYNSRAIILGEKLLEKKSNRLARSIFSKVISSSGKDFSVKEKIIQICMKYREFAFAKKLLNEAMKDYPSNFDLVYNAGVVCEMMGDVDKALEYYLETERVQSSRLEVKLKIAKIFFDRNKVLQADNYLNMVLRKDPENEKALSLRNRI